MKTFTYLLKSLFMSFLLIAGSYLSVFSQQVEKNLTSSNGDLLGFLQYTPTDYNQNTNKYPLIIFLHGIGERGNGASDLHNVACCGLPRIIKLGNKMTFNWNGKKETFLVLSPQCPKKYWMWPSLFVDDLINYAKTNLRIDEDRIFLTGLSMGGGGTYRYISHNAVNPTRFAAAATICAPCFIEDASNVAKAGLPVWSFHAKDDSVAKAACTEAAIAAINKANPSVVPLKTIWPQGGHLVWDRVYTDTSYQYDGILNIYEWFLGQKKNAAPNKLPVANVGPDLQVTTASGTAQLNGAASTDADGKLVRFVWKKLSGPAAGVIASPFGPASSTSITGLTIAGTYKYQLAVVDDRASFDKDTLTITVTTAAATPNKAPVANAGTELSLTLPINTTNFDGSASTDADGTITSYAWSKVSGGTAVIASISNAKTAISGLEEGSYSFKLVVTDNKGAKAESLVRVTVKPAPNQLPIANTGNAPLLTLPVDTATLDGSASTDADGSIASYAWSKVSGGTAVIANASSAITAISGLEEGTYSFKLVVTDNKGAKAEGSVTVQVNPSAIIVLTPPVIPPVTRPADTVVNTIPVDTIVKTIPVDTIRTIPQAPQGTPVKNNILPVVRAGADLSMTLPNSYAFINGALSTDADGWVISYVWSQISGPAAILNRKGNGMQASMSDLTAGTYVFRLTAIDNAGDSAYDDMTITVKAAPATVPVVRKNVAPVVRVGQDLTMTLPNSYAFLNGALTTDADGWVVNYSWSQLSGPAVVLKKKVNGSQASISDMSAGLYRFRLTAIDNAGDSAYDDLTIIVNPANTVVPPVKQYMPPVIRAGNDVTMTLPNSYAFLSGHQTTVEGGWITRYEWSQISGPAAEMRTKVHGMQVSLWNLVAGVYVFRLTGVDNHGNSAYDEVTVTVNNKAVPTVSSASRTKAAIASSGAAASKVSVFPNPATSTVNIMYSSAATGKSIVNVYDLNGTLVKSAGFEKGPDAYRKNLDVSALKAGVYQVQVLTGNKEKINTRFVKQ